MVIYLDMDGVLCDLDGALCAEFGLSPSEIMDRSVRETAIRERIAKRGLDHWRSLPPLEPKFWRETIPVLAKLGSVEILTSYGDSSRADGGAQAHQGKWGWLAENFLSEIQSGLIRRFNGVQNCEQKALFGRPGSVLLDDQDQNVAGFRATGGAAFWWPSDLPHFHSWIRDASE